MNLYLITDVCLLANVFDNFRRTLLDKYRLDQVNFISATHLA